MLIYIIIKYNSFLHMDIANHTWRKCLFHEPGLRGYLEAVSLLQQLNEILEYCDMKAEKYSR